MSLITRVGHRLLHEAERLVRQPRRRVLRRRTFQNWREYEQAAMKHDSGQTVAVTRDGLKIAIRHNKWDWVIVEEQFIDRHYVRHFTPPAGRQPVVVDIGGYIGDFALWCASNLRAKVVVYEPTAENWAFLQRNLALNADLTDVVAVNKGVSSTPEVVSNVQVIGQEIHASSAWYADDPTAERRTFPCDTLTEVLAHNGLDRVDLLKVDCEGGEYDIFDDVPEDTYRRIDQIVLEWHQVPDYADKVRVLERRFEAAGFTLRRRYGLLYATR